MLLASSLFSTLKGASGASALAPKGGVTVDVDLTFVWPILILIVLVFVLKPLLFEPMLQLFEEREKRIDGAKLAARKMDESSAAALTKYETEMKKARAEGNAARDAQRAEGLKTENEIVGKVREATGATVTAGRKEIDEEARQVRTALKADAKVLAAAMASRVLGREVQG